MCAEFKNLDESYFYFFLESVSEMVGSELTKGILERIGLKIANIMLEKFSKDSLKVDSLDDLIKPGNPITMIDKTLKVQDEQVLILEKCPFSHLIESYINIADASPPEMDKIVKSYNEEGKGYAVSPLCIIHQTIRSELSKHIQVAGKNCELLQLGCKSLSGEIEYGEENIETLSKSKEDITKYLEDHVCTYAIRKKE